MRYQVRLAGKTHQLELQREKNFWRLQLDGREISAEAVPVSADTLSILIDGKSFDVKHEVIETGVAVFISGRRYDVSIADPRSWQGRTRMGTDEAGPQKLVSSMPGKVVRVLAQEGDKIVSGQGIAVVEAMKMQNEIRSPRAGVLKKLLAQEGMKVDAGEVLAIVE